jgi:cytoskeleton protein RodZ
MELEGLREIPMTQVGETLRRERLKRNLDIEQISHELKISARFLEAIEKDQYDKLPGGVFAKSFVRQYARMLGLDEDDLTGQLQGVIAPPPDITLLAEKPKPASVAPIQVPKVEEWETVGDRGFRWSGSLSAAVMVVVVMLVCSAVYAWLQRPKSTVATPSTTAPVQAAAASPPVQAPPPAPVQAAEQKPAETNSPQTAAVVSKPVENKPAESKPAENKPVEPKPTASAPAVPNPEATVHVQITADEPVWVLARADGKYAFSATLSAGDTRMVEGVKDVVIRLGNAGGVTISLNGKPIGTVGPKGQTRTLQLTSGGFQIVPAKPPSAPLDPIDRL